MNDITTINKWGFIQEDLANRGMRIKTNSAQFIVTGHSGWYRLFNSLEEVEEFIKIYDLGVKDGRRDWVGFAVIEPKDYSSAGCRIHTTKQEAEDDAANCDNSEYAYVVDLNR